jgi:hypothetical protein
VYYWSGGKFQEVTLSFPHSGAAVSQTGKRFGRRGWATRCHLRLAIWGRCETRIHVAIDRHGMSWPG